MPLKPKDWVPPTQEQLQKKFRSQLAKLKVHLLRGCAMAFHNNADETAYISEVSEKPYVAILYWNNGRDGDGEDCYGFDNRPAVTDDLTKVTCGYCKSKLLNEIWYKDWKDLNPLEISILNQLRIQREERKARGEKDYE